ncbi:hypothetical protein QL285_016901 [Trifolium repens]|nr:hypothetical protein QL285_016901 [Trifolium repens]
MASSSSQQIVQGSYNPVLPPMLNFAFKESFSEPPNTNNCGMAGMEFITEKFVDFDSLKANGIDIQDLFFDQQWENYFNMLNGFVYFDIVKNFWNKAYVFDKFDADNEVRLLVEKNPNLKGQSREQLGLRPFRGKEIRSHLLGMSVVIKQEHIAKMLGLDNKGRDVNEYKGTTKYTSDINKDLFPAGTSAKEFGKAKFMHENFNIAFRVFINSFVTREGGKDSIYVPHKHFIWFMHKRMKINLAKLLFDHLCTCIKENHNKAKAIIHHPRLISELIRQTRLIEILRAHEKLRVFNTAKLDASILANMKLKTKEEILRVKDPLKEVYETYFWCNGFPTISEADNDEVIKNFLQMVYIDTGVRIPREMVAGSPWDIYKSFKEVTRNRRKPITTEEDIVEPSEEKDSVDDMVDDEEATETVEAQETTPERRTKKRHDRDPSDAEEQAQAQPSKRTKSRAQKHKGMSSKPTIKSSTDAQGLPPQSSPLPQTKSIPDPPTKSEQPDETIKPITMMLPNSSTQTCLLSSNSSSSPSTNSDSSATESDIGSDPEVYIKSKLQKHQKKPITKPRVRTSHKPSSEPLNMTKAYTEENPHLNLLVSHASGDAFTSSALNTPVVSPSVYPNPNSEHLNTPVHNSPFISQAENIIADEPSAEPVNSEPPSSTPLPSDIPSTSQPDQDIPSIPSDQDIEDLNVIPVYQASMLNLEEQLYEQAAEAEQARLAAEAEQARIAAAAESQKLVQQQDVGTSDDTVMVDASTVVTAADKGKGILEGPSAPTSAVAVISPSKPIASELPPAVLAALDDIRNEMRDEIDILRADLREDSQKVAESTNKRLDEISGSTNKRLDDMMELLLKLAKNNP